MPAPVIAAALAIGLVAAAVIFRMGAGSNFHVDDWSFVLYRNGHSPEVFLDPHNEHLSLLPVLLYKTLFELVGLGNYAVFRALLILTNLAGAGLLLVVLTRYVKPWVALLLCVPIVLMGPAWSALYSPFQISFAGSMAVGLAALLALERRTRRGDAIAGLLLVASLACSGLGLSWLVAAAVEVGLRRRALPRLWVVAIPALLYGLWYLVYGGGGSRSLRPVGDAVTFVFNAAASATGGYAGLDVTWGRTLLVAGIALAVWRIAKLGRLPVRTISALGAAVAFWGLTGLVREPATFGESRYLLPGAIFLVLAAAPLLPRTAPSRGVLAGGAFAAAVAVLAGSAYLSVGRTILVDSNQPLYARLQALELARPVVDPGFVPDTLRAAEVNAGRYFAAIDRYGGSPALPLDEVRAAGPGTRREFDDALLNAYRVQLVPATARPGGSAPVLEAGNASASGGSCLVGGGGPVAVRLVSTGLIVEPPAEGPAAVRLRRLGDDVLEAFTLTAPQGERSQLQLVSDRLPEPWRATVEGPAGTRICSTAG